MGQLAAVREYSGQSNHALYATTLYAYDVLGNLTSVKDNSNNLTSLTYDALGRKLTMNDLDMGYWEYGYDPAGNILRQEDNAGQFLCFSYDELNRLTGKRHDTTGNGCETTDLQLAAYTYHTTGGGKGQVSQIFWSNSTTQNKESFGYDSLGRLTTHNRWVDGRLYSQSYSNFDPFHRPANRTLTYPNGNSETVTTTFDHEGENGLTAGGQSNGQERHRPAVEPNIGTPTTNKRFVSRETKLLFVKSMLLYIITKTICQPRRIINLYIVITNTLEVINDKIGLGQQAMASL